MAITTVVGGSTVTYSETGAAGAAAVAALASLGSGYSASDVSGSLTSPPVAGDFNVYNVDPSSGYARVPVGAQALVVTGDNNVILVGSTTTQLLVGNEGNDSIHAGAGAGTVIAGDGDNVLALDSAASEDIVTGTGTDTVLMTGGAATISGSGKDVVNLASGNSSVTGETALTVSIKGGQNVLNLVGGSSVYIGVSGSDTINLGSTGPGSTVGLYAMGDDSLTLTGHAGDLVDVFSADNTIAATGSINFEVTSSGDEFDVTGSAGQTNDFTFTGGAGAISLSGGGAESVSGPASITVTDQSAYTLTLAGNDTISFGSGNDTILVVGTATVSSGPSGVSFTGGTGTASVTAGSGASTLIGGSGQDTFIGGSGPVTFMGGAAIASMVGGSGANTFEGGSKFDTMVGGGTSNVFTFDSSVGGTHVIENFVAGEDTINLVGYGATIPNSEIQYSAITHNTTITLDGGQTKITVIGYHVTASDIVTH